MEKNQDILDAMRLKLLELETKHERLTEQKAQFKTQVTGFDTRAEVLAESAKGLERERKTVEAKALENQMMLDDTEERLTKLKEFIESISKLKV